MPWGGRLYVLNYLSHRGKDGSGTGLWVIDVRLYGTARHLSDPDNLVYMLGTEGELFELNVYTLEACPIFDLTRELDTDGEFGCHFKIVIWNLAALWW